MSVRGRPAGQPERLDHNLRSVIHTRFGSVAEGELMAFNLDLTSSRCMVGIIQGAHFGVGFFSEVQLHALNADMTTAWPVADVVQ